MRLNAEISRNLLEVDDLVFRMRDAATPYLDEARLYGFEIAVSEALTNSIKYSPASPQSDTFRILMAHRCGFLLVGIYEPTGQSDFNLEAQSRHMPEADDLAVNGRGIALIHACADEARFRVRNGKNQLAIAFKTNKRPIKRRTDLAFRGSNESKAVSQGHKFDSCSDLFASDGR